MKASLIESGRPEDAANARTRQLAPEKGGRLRRRFKQLRGLAAHSKARVACGDARVAFEPSVDT